MQIRFINRYDELKFLDGLYIQDKFQFIIIHGRRRVGKSFLLKHFLLDKRHIYLQIDETSQKVQLEYLYLETTKQLLGTPLLFNNIDDYFEFIFKQGSDEPLVFVLDEYQYLIKSIVGLNSIIQRWIDNKWVESKIFLILCGSEIRMMEDLFAYHNPLHGRRTGQWKLEPFDVKACSEYFPDTKIDELIKIINVYGTMPAYLQYYDTKISFDENIKNTMLSMGHPLNEEPLHLLRQEFREVNRYFAIIQSIAGGETRMSNIASATGIEARSIHKYLQNLIAIDLLRREQPVGTKYGQNKYVLYKINDQFIRFWFKFINPNRNLLQRQGKNAVMSQIKEKFNDFMGEGFEIVCRQIVASMNAKKLFGEYYIKMGPWWKKNIEFDFILIADKEAIFFEFKYGRNINGKIELQKLKGKINDSLFSGYNKQDLVIIARKFSDDSEGCITIEKLWGSYINHTPFIPISINSI